MRLGDSDAYRLQFAAIAAEFAGAGAFGQLIEDVPGQKFGGGVATLEFGHVVEIAIIQCRHHGLERIMGATDVDDDAVAIDQTARSAAAALLPELAAKVS